MINLSVISVPPFYFLNGLPISHLFIVKLLVVSIKTFLGGPMDGCKRERRGESSMRPSPVGCFLGNIFLVQFDKGVQRGKDTFDIHKVGTALDAVAPMVFAKILSEKFIDMTGQENVDRRIQKFLWR